MPSLRWAFKCSNWQPKKTEWMLAAQCIQPEEKTRVGRFMFQRDAKFAMVGRLMIRKAVSEQLGIPYKDVKLSRSEKGKPVIENPGASGRLCFNVSHQGAYTVLAAESSSSEIGVDVMDFERPRGCKSIPHYFEQMKGQYTKFEWEFVRAGSGENDQLSRFYRCWCLKESYVKALGVGIGFELQRIEFHVHSPTLHKDKLVTDTSVTVDGEPEKSWLFQESLLDDKHCVAVGIKDGVNMKDEDNIFRELTFNELIQNAEPISDPDEEYWLCFNNKEPLPQRKS